MTHRGPFQHLPFCDSVTRGNGFKLKEGRFRRYIGYKEEIFYNEGGETLARLPREEVDAPSLETFKARLDGSEQPDVVETVPAHCRGIGLDGL